MPVVFFCHASEDKPLAREIAAAFVHAGIDTFLDEWEIGTGDSFRQKIDAGIDRCTHFVVLLTPASITKPWVRFELDAGVAGYLDGRNKLFPLRAGLNPRDLPPTLQGLNAPEIVETSRDLPVVISDIYGVSRKPPLGPPPTVTFNTALATQGGLSPAAFAIAVMFALQSVNARFGDPQITARAISSACAITDDALVEALDELERAGFVEAVPHIHVTTLPSLIVMAKPALFMAVDRFTMPWDTTADARAVAATLMNEHGGNASSPEVAASLGWTARRLNPAVSVLVTKRIVESGHEINPEWEHVALRATSRTKAFLRD